MKFKDKFPNYNIIHSDKLYYSEFPPGFVDGYSGIITKYTSESIHLLKQVINIICSNIPESPTTNWGIDFLQNDLINTLYRLSKKPFHKLMDTTIDIYNTINDNDMIDEFNEYFSENDFGYRLDEDHNGVHWNLIESTDTKTQEIVSETLIDIKSICKQSYQHIEQLVENLKSDKLRSDKDALRDAMSAMESLLKNITETSDIKDATNKLKGNTNQYGPNEIVKDGLSIWNKIHELYPDVRHGDPSISEIKKEIVIYWIERILVYIRYIIKVI